jgi:sugar phosphate isomerase/epimerase
VNPLSFNYYVCPDSVSLAHFVPLAAAAGAKAVGLTVRAIRENEPQAIKRLLHSHGLKVSSLNSAGYFLFSDAAKKKEQEELNARLIAAAAELGAETLMVIAGGLSHGSWRMDEARGRIEEGVAGLAEQARRAEVQLAVEPIHPLGVLEKGCVNTIRQGLALARPYANVGLTLDFFHSWWDPDFLDFPEREKLKLVQICNVSAPDRPEEFHREVLENGFIDVAAAMRRLRDAGYKGYFEFEMFPPNLRGRKVESIIAAVGRQYEWLAKSENKHS